jgi:hypothetical protein
MLKLFLLLAKLVLFTTIISFSLILFHFEYRHFYSLNAKERVTVWRCYNGKSYIIPGRYYGLIPPTKNYIESPTKNDVTLYFSDGLPGTIIVKTYETGVTMHQSYSKDKNSFMRFVDYNSNQNYYHQLLYKPNAGRVSDINLKSRFIFLNIYDIYARDNQGNRL